MCGRGGRRCAVLLLLVMTPAPSAGAPALLGQPLQAVRFQNDAWVDEVGLRRLLPLQVGQPITAAALDRTGQILRRTEIFRSVDVQPAWENGGAVVVLYLQRKRIIISVEVTGYQQGRWNRFRQLLENLPFVEMGNEEQLPWREVRRVVRLRSGMFFDEEAVAAAAERLRKRYQNIGYVTAEVDTDVEEVRPGEVRVRFRITQGRPLIVGAAVVAGETGVEPNELEAVLAGLVGRPRRRETVREAGRTLLRHLREAGYYEARVDPVWLESGAAEGLLRCVVDAGPRFIIGVTGNENRSRAHLLRHMDLRGRLIITDSTWRELARRMVRGYQEEGFYRATVDVQVGDGDPTRVDFAIAEGRRYAIRKLNLEGNHQISSQQLRKQMVTRPARRVPWPRSGALVDQVVDDDLGRLSAYYLERGFESAKVVDTRRVVDDQTGAIDLTVMVDEGPRTAVREVQPAGFTVPGDGELQLRVRAGEPLSPEALTEDQGSILGAFKRAGYVDAKVDFRVEREQVGNEIAALVNWDIVPGPQRKIGHILLRGNVEVHDEVILRELPFRSGEPLATKKLLEAQQNIRGLGLFRAVSVVPISPGPAPGRVDEKGEQRGDEHEQAIEEHVQDVAVDVVARAPGRLNLGGGYNTRDGIVGFAEMAYDNLARRARRLTLRGQFSVEPPGFEPSQYLGRLGYGEPHILGSRWKLDSNIVGERNTRSIEEYSIERISLTNVLSRKLWRGVQGGGELLLEYSDVFDVDPLPFRSEDEVDSLTVGLSPFLVYDGRDDPFDPRRGFLESLRLRYNLPELSDVEAGKVVAQHTQFIPLSDRLDLVYLAQVGWGRALGGARVLPIRERFFLGGRTSVRGFAENSLGPYDENGNETGGDFALNTTLELRVRLLYGFGAAMFVDGGGLYLLQCNRACRVGGSSGPVHDAELSLHNFRRSAGLGLRYMTPVGPISLDYGIKLDRRTRTLSGGRSDRESFGELHFTIGATF